MTPNTTILVQVFKGVFGDALTDRHKSASSILECALYKNTNMCPCKLWYDNTMMCPASMTNWVWDLTTQEFYAAILKLFNQNTKRLYTHIVSFISLTWNNLLHCQVNCEHDLRTRDLSCVRCGAQCILGVLGTVSSALLHHHYVCHYFKSTEALSCCMKRKRKMGEK